MRCPYYAGFDCIANYASLCAMELNVNEENICKGKFI